MTKHFGDWASHFASNDWIDSPEMDWDTAPRVSAFELRLVAKSLRQFQLGEYSDGRSLRACAAKFEAAHGILHLADATRFFVMEEQRHSLVLGRFLEREGVARLERDPIDDTFRWLRKLAGFELSITVLSTAECISVPYYSAVRDSTKSDLLQRICSGILRDEALHLCYQGHVLALFSRRRGFWKESITRTLHRLLLLGVGCIVYVQHASFFRAAGMPLQKFLGRAFQSLAQIEQRIGSGALVGLGWLAQGRQL
jgi:hypothetical protein